MGEEEIHDMDSKDKSGVAPIAEDRTPHTKAPALTDPTPHDEEEIRRARRELDAVQQAEKRADNIVAARSSGLVAGPPPTFKAADISLGTPEEEAADTEHRGQQIADYEREREETERQRRELRDNCLGQVDQVVQPYYDSLSQIAADALYEDTKVEEEGSVVGPSRFKLRKTGDKDGKPTYKVTWKDGNDGKSTLRFTTSVPPEKGEVGTVNEVDSFHYNDKKWDSMRIGPFPILAPILLPVKLLTAKQLGTEVEAKFSKGKLQTMKTSNRPRTGDQPKETIKYNRGSEENPDPVVEYKRGLSQGDKTREIDFGEHKWHDMNSGNKVPDLVKQGLSLILKAPAASK